MDYHPKYIAFPCAYLASKVEKFSVDISQFITCIICDREKAIQIFLNRVRFLMQQINFDQFVERLLTLIKTRYTKISDPEHLQSKIEEFLDKIQFTDAYFLHSRSEIALAAGAYGAVKFKENIVGYLKDILYKNQPEKLACMVTAIENILLMLNSEALQIRNPVRDFEQILEKLDKCQNKKYNPSSAASKRKLEEQDEDEDIEPAQKYSKPFEK